MLKNVMIVGLGLIGGSLAMAVKENNDFNIIGFDKNIEVLKKAKEGKVIDDFCIEPSEALSKCDLIIIALYPKATINFVRENMKHFKKDALIIDATGIKREVVSEIQGFLREDIEFLGTHPMAGKEEAGFENADSKIFKNCRYILTPTSKNKKETIDEVTKLIKSIGTENIIIVSPEEHDKIIAYTSHLTHIAAVALMNSVNEAIDVSPFIGGSFRDMTRVAAINGELWEELLRTNKEYVIEVIEDFESELLNIKNAIKNNDKEKLLELFKKAHDLRKGIK